jgi:hypothetical protein
LTSRRPQAGPRKRARVSFSALRGTRNGASFLFQSASHRIERPIFVFSGVSNMLFC